jgi:hypothetical protein
MKTLKIDSCEVKGFNYHPSYSTTSLVDWLLFDEEVWRRELTKHGMTRTDKEVCDSTSAKETRSMLIMDDNTVGISSVNSTVLANRANIGFSEKESKDED